VVESESRSNSSRFSTKPEQSIGIDAKQVKVLLSSVF
jgi:hypothetical protein